VLWRINIIHWTVDSALTTFPLPLLTFSVMIMELNYLLHIPPDAGRSLKIKDFISKDAISHDILTYLQCR